MREGLLCGGSSGAAFSVAMGEARKLKAGERLVVMLPDSIRNYMTKHLDDDWMVEKGFMQASAVGDRSQPWAANTVSELALESPVTISPGIALRRAVEIMNAKGFDQLPVVDVGGRVMGVVTEGNISAKVTSGAASLDDPVETIVYKDVARVLSSTTLAELSRKFNRYHFALVTRNQTRYSNAGEEIHTMVTAVVTRIDLLKFISAKAHMGAPPTASPRTSRRAREAGARARSRTPNCRRGMHAHARGGRARQYNTTLAVHNHARTYTVSNDGQVARALPRALPPPRRARVAVAPRAGAARARRRLPARSRRTSPHRSKSWIPYGIPPQKPHHPPSQRPHHSKTSKWNPKMEPASARRAPPPRFAFRTAR